MIPEEVVERIKDAAKIEEVVGERFPLKKSGADSYVANCPFHAERTGSFHVTPSKGMAYCFGCGWGGNVVRFVMDANALTFPEAMRELGSKYGIEVPIVETREEKAYRLERSRRMANLDEVQAIFTGGGGSDFAVAELMKRGFEHEDLLREWGVGCGVSGKTSLELIHCEDFRESRDDEIGPIRRFRDRLTFPIRDHQGKLLGWSGRTLVDHRAKYVNSPGSKWFEKGKVLFGLDMALRAILREEKAFIVEGQIDVLAMHDLGHTNTVAPLGTSLTEDQVATLARYTQTAILVFDGDFAGRKAASRAFKILASFGFHVEAIFLPEGKDPGDCLQGLKLPKPEGYLEGLVKRAPADPGELKRFVTGIEKLVSKIADPVVRNATARQVGSALGIERLNLSPDKVKGKNEVPKFPFPVELALAAKGKVPGELPGEEGEFVHLVAEIGLEMAIIRNPKFAFAALNLPEGENLELEAKLDSLSRDLMTADDWHLLEKVAEILKAT